MDRLFVKNQKVRSIRTGLNWIVVGYDLDTLDGAHVVLVKRPDHVNTMFPVPEHHLEALR